MNQKGTTKDELFLLKLHEMALKRGDIWAEVDRIAVGQAIGQNDRAIENIVRHLAQANFIKKGEEKGVYLTDNGLRLVLELLEDRKR
jgi:Mn-dependent DtxR family transcriptional regulator